MKVPIIAIKEMGSPKISTEAIRVVIGIP
jgi:hypothetical protein